MRYYLKLKRVINNCLDFFFAKNEIEKNSHKLLYHRPNTLNAIPNVSEVNFSTVNDSELVRRIISAYQRVAQADLGDSMWKTFFASYHQPVHDALVSGAEQNVREILRNPDKSDIFYGFDILTKTYNGSFQKKRTRKAYSKLCLDGLVRFAEATGCAPLDNPETWSVDSGRVWETESLLELLNKDFGSFSLPNSFPNEYGLKTSRGVLSFRVPQALYQAWRIKKLLNSIENPRVLEIGAGLGRTAFYAHEMGIKDYTIVDIPISTVAQAYYLGMGLGENKVWLDGEEPDDNDQKVKIISPQTFHADSNKYDLIINVDSLSEMSLPVAQAYWKKIKENSEMFLSINHEANPFRAVEVIGNDLKVQRNLYWMRKGYVEELVKFNHKLPVKG